MKKLIIPAFSMVFMLSGCAKTEKTTNAANQVSTESTLPVAPETKDTTNGATETEQQKPSTESPPKTETSDTAPPDIPKGPTDGVVTTEKYIYSDYPSNNLPMEKLTRKITNENQVVYVKIQDAKAGESFRIKVEHSNPHGNISIQHVYGHAVQDGPFGREANYTVPKNGDYTFAIQKNTRAEGKQTGEILITVIKK